MLNPLVTAINDVIREFDLNITNRFANLDIDGAGVSPDDRDTLTDDDMKVLEPKMVTAQDDPLSILWVILRDTGARVSEICRRTVANVDFQQESIDIPIGKTKNAKRGDPSVPCGPCRGEGIGSG